MKDALNRRDFSKGLVIGLGAAAALRAAEPRKIKIGYTCLIWNAGPRTPENLETRSKTYRASASISSKHSPKFWRAGI